MTEMSVVRNITIRSKTEGIEATTGQLRQLAAAQTGVASASVQTTRQTLSYDAALNKMRMTYDPVYRATIRQAEAERILNGARAQGLVGLAEQNRLSSLAATRLNGSAGMLGGIGGAKALLGGLGIGLGISELAKVPGEIAGIVHEVSGLSHIADTIGITTKSLQELEFAGKTVHITTESMNAALEKFSKNLGIAASGGGELGKILALNHVKITGDVTKDFLNVANLIEHTTNAEQRNLITTAAFGKTAEEMGLLFEHGAAGIQQAMDEADRIGGVFSDEKIRQIADVDKAFIAFETTLSVGFKSAVVGAISLFGDLENAQVGYFERLHKEGGIKLPFGITFGSGIDPIEESVSKALGGSGDLSRDQAVAGLAASMKKPAAASQARLTKIDFGGRFDPFSGDSSATNTNLGAASAAEAAQKKFQTGLDAANKQTIALKAQADSLNMTAGAAAEYQKRQELINLALENHVKLSPDVASSINDQASAYGKATTELEKMKDAQAAQQFLAQSLFDAVRGATSLSDAFGKLAKSIADAVLQAALLGSGPMAGFFGTTKSSSGGLFGSLAQMFLGGFGGGAHLGGGGIGHAHTGGIIGASSLVSSFVHPAYFDDAPRFHGGGIAGDEVPIIARRGEGVFTPEQMQAMGGGNVSVVINNNHSDVDVQQRSERGPNGTKLILDIVSKGMTGGHFDGPLRGRYGHRPQKVSS